MNTVPHTEPAAQAPLSTLPYPQRLRVFSDIYDQAALTLRRRLLGAKTQGERMAALLETGKQIRTWRRQLLPESLQP